jgi:ADP-heptose:LPS heptosyltransferase
LTNPEHGPLKRLEVGFRSVFNKTFLAQRQPVVITDLGSVLSLTDRPKILLLRQDRIGDVLVTTPLLKAIRERFPNGHLAMLLSKNNVGIRHAVEPYVDEMIVYRKNLRSLISVIRSIRRGRFDVVIDLMDNASSTSSLIISRSHARYALGVDKVNRGVYTHVVPLLSQQHHHIVERISRLLLPLGVDLESTDLRPIYHVTAEDLERARSILGIDGKGAYCGVILSGSMEGKRYGREETISVIQQLQSTHPSVQFFIFGAPGEGREVQQIAESTGASGVPPSNSFHEFATRLRAMTCMWTPDTSSVHLAAAWNMPCCVMFNKDSHGRMAWFPYNTHCEALFSETGTLASIPRTDVVEAIERLFAYCGITKD